MTEQPSNGGAMNAKIDRLLSSEKELFGRVNKLETTQSVLETKVHEYMSDQQEMKSDVKAIKDRLYAFDIDQAKKWTKAGVIGSVVFIVFTTLPGLIFTVMKILEMIN